jgi:hypothetical protein
MTIKDFLALLDGIKRCRHGWQVRCPAHADKSPSLSVTEGEDGRILVKCWAGCTVEAITTALGITLCDLFQDNHLTPRRANRARLKRETRWIAIEKKRKQAGARIDQMREAEYLIRSAHNIDISRWSNAMLDAVLNQLADAHDLLATEEA